MELRIAARNFAMTPDAQKYIQKKFLRLERHLKSISDAKLEVSRTSARSQSDRVVAQMTLKVSSYTLRGQESGLNLFAAVDAVTDVMDRQIRRFKGKVYRTSQANKSARANLARAGVSTQETEGSSGGEEVPLPELGKVVKTKRFEMDPKTAEDAILEMELLSHSFFFFYNVETHEYNVAYRRHDGDYGVIEPELV